MLKEFEEKAYWMGKILVIGNFLKARLHLPRKEFDRAVLSKFEVQMHQLTPNARMLLLS